MAKNIFVLLLGNKEQGEVNEFQLLQEETALAEGRRTGLGVEVQFAPGFDQARALKKRLMEAPTKPLDAVVTEPASTAALDLILRDLKGKAGLILLNAWGPSVEEYSRLWGSEHPLGTVSTDHTKIGEIQGRQISAILADGGTALLVTGPGRSSAAQQRLAGTKATLKPQIKVLDTEAGQWTEADGAAAFNSWYGVFKARNETVHVIAAQNDELAMGARNAAQSVLSPAHKDMFLKARYLGVDASPRYGRRLVDSSSLAASITTPANTGTAIAHLLAFWRDHRPVPLRAFTEVTPYPAGSVKG